MRTSAPGNNRAPTLAAAAAALPHEGAGSPWGGPAANRTPARPLRGFTLLELLVVVAIIAIASAGVAFALRDTGSTRLEREGQRLAAVLEAARAQSRLSGLPVRWMPAEGGFRFEGLADRTAIEPWLDPAIAAPNATVLLLGPEPIIPPQAVELVAAGRPEASVRVATDGLRPFAVTRGAP